MIIRLIIQTILLYPTGAVWTDEAGNVSRLNPSGADQIDAEHPTRNRKVGGFTIAGKTPEASASDRPWEPPTPGVQVVLSVRVLRERWLDAGIQHG